MEDKYIIIIIMIPIFITLFYFSDKISSLEKRIEDLEETNNNDFNNDDDEDYE
jgi:regulatory protein YycI of two-component signal transduction system YycFG